MEPNEYLKTILGKQSLGNDSPEVLAMARERHAVETLLRDRYGDSPKIRYGGSRAKGTMVRESYDLDIICYFGHEDNDAGDSLEAIYNDVRKCLESKYAVQPKTSALRLQKRDDRTDFHIDVVPGRFVDGDGGDAFLYQAAGPEKRLKTNLQVHIDHIRNSGLIDEVKLVKLWNIRWGLGLKTFILELLVIKLLKGARAKGLADRLVNLWEQLKDNANDLSVEDPANPTGNDLSEILNEKMKRTLSSLASRTLNSIEQQGWESVFGPAKEVSDQEKVAAIEVLTSRRPAAPKLWCP